jgi:hypothetical protein
VYYRARPNLGIRASKLRKLDEHFGLQPTLAGFERLYKDGHLAIVHGVGYDHPSFSHFSSMAYWHTGAPNSGDAFGWLGRLADGMDKRGIANFLVDIESHQSLAVRARNHVPLVFDNPEKFTRGRLFEEQSARATRARVSCSTWRRVRRTPRCMCARLAPPIARRWITACSSSGWSGWRR